MAGVVSTLAPPAFASDQRGEDAPLERRSNFDRQWKFLLGDPPGASSASFDDHAWKLLHLAHDWSTEGSFAEDAPAKGNGAYLPTGVGWYRKSLVLPRSPAGKRVVLEFDGVYQRSEVWVNGVSLGMRPYGFSSFAHDLTPHLAAPGKQNQIAVRVDNSLQPNCRWYTGSGIYRHTWLRVTNPLHIARWGVFVRTPVISSDSSTVAITTRIRNDGTGAKELELRTEVFDPEGKPVRQGATQHSVEAGGNSEVTHTLNVASPRLWSQATPHLYQVRVTVISDGSALDRETTAFGIRDARFDVDRG